MQVPLRNMAGETIGQIELDDAIFAAPINRSVMHQALLRQLANARLGTHDTKTRSEVRGGGRKPWRQKGTGRARHGTIRSPLWRGGGITFGPSPRSYEQKMPRKMRRLAVRSALSAKAQGEQIVILEDLHMDAPRTREMRSLLERLDIDGRSTLILLPAKAGVAEHLHEVDGDNAVAVELSARNLPDVKTLRATYLNVRDLLGHDYIVMTQAALSEIQQWLGNGE